MHRWQSLSTAAYRPQCSRDIARVAQGIEASLRSFHVSAIVAADESPSTSRPRASPIPPTRRAAAAQAGQEIARLPSQPRITRITSPPSQGAPPAGVRMARLNPNAPLIRGGPLARGGLRGRGGVRGGARGGRGGRGRGDGERRPNRRRSNTSNDAGSSRDSDLPGAVEPAEADAFSVLEGYEHKWRTDTEARDYTDIMEIVEDAHTRNAEAVQMLKEANKSGDDAQKSRAQGILDAVAQDVKRGLDKLVEAQEAVFPSYTPLQLKDGSKPVGMVGGVPVAKDGFGAIVEDALRIIGNRRGHKFEEPRNLARKLIAGEIVKFTDPYEKLVVTRLANELAYKDEGADAVGFEPLAPAARGDLVKSIVAGRYDNHAAGVQGDAMKNVARITGGNPTYTSGGQGTVLEALQSMLPAQKPQAPRAQPAAR